MIRLLILSKSKNYAALAAPHKAKVSMQWEAHGRSALRPIVSIRPASERRKLHAPSAGDRLPQRKIGTGRGTGRDIAGHLSRT
jgi:hypothetical protein